MSYRVQIDVVRHDTAADRSIQSRGRRMPSSDGGFTARNITLSWWAVDRYILIGNFWHSDRPRAGDQCVFFQNSGNRISNGRKEKDNHKRRHFYCCFNLVIERTEGRHKRRGLSSSLNPSHVDGETVSKIQPIGISSFGCNRQPKCNNFS